LTRLAATVLRAPVALVTLVDAERQYFASGVGLPEPWASTHQTPLSHSFCQYTLASAEPLIISNARKHPLVRDNLAIPDLGVAAYAGIPLVTSSGHILGSFCVIDHQPRDWTTAEIGILTDLAASVVTEIELRLALRDRERLGLATQARADALAATLDAMADGVIVYDANGAKVGDNAALRRILGLEAYPTYDTLPFAERAARARLRDADGRPVSPEDTAPARALRGDEVSSAEAQDLWCDTFDGRAIVINVSASPICDAEGRVAGAVAVYRDVTERRRLTQGIAAERDRLRQVLDTLPAGVLIADADGHMAVVNNRAHAFLGATMLEETDDTYGFRRSDGTPYPARELPLHRSLARGEVVSGEQMLAREASTGRDIPLLVDSAPLRDPDGRLAGAVAVLRDITALKDLDRARDDFLSAAAHDLKTPLTSISGYAQLLRRRLGRMQGVNTAPSQEQIERIEAAAGRMLALVNDLLDLARGQLGATLALDHEPTDLVALVRRAVAEQQGMTTTRVVVEAPDTLVADVDAERIARVVGNLLSNAIKYSPQGGDVTIRVTREGGDVDPAALIAVEDRGVGIPAEDVPHIFERFQRGSNVVGRIRGTGLGLASSMQSVAEHGGTLSVDSQEGAGSVFTVRLPLVKTDHQPGHEKPADPITDAT